LKGGVGITPRILIEERLCQRYGCLPSQLRKENTDDIDYFLRIFEIDKENEERELKKLK
jgi:hypothetical protein